MAFDWPHDNMCATGRGRDPSECPGVQRVGCEGNALTALNTAFENPRYSVRCYEVVDVDEDILAAVAGRDEAEPTVVDPPLHGTRAGHGEVFRV